MVVLDAHTKSLRGQEVTCPLREHTLTFSQGEKPCSAGNPILGCLPRFQRKMRTPQRYLRCAEGRAEPATTELHLQPRLYLLFETGYLCYSSEGKGILAVWSQGLAQSHTTQQASYKRFIGKDARWWLPLLGPEVAENRVRCKRI